MHACVCNQEKHRVLAMTCMYYTFDVNTFQLLMYFKICIFSNKHFKSFCFLFMDIFVAAIEIKSDATLAEAVQILSENKLLSAPVVDVDAQEDASWIDRYIGIVEFAGIVVWILHQVSILTIAIHMYMHRRDDFYYFFHMK